MQITNTLTRWHKIVERINTSIQEKETAIATLNLSVRASTVEIFDMVAKNVNADLMSAESIFQDRLALSALAFKVRSTLAKANVQHGVSDLLCEIEMLRKNVAAMGVFVVGGVSFEQTQELANRKLASSKETIKSSSTNAVDLAHREKNETLRFSIISASMKEKFEKQIQESKMKILALNDKLSDVNATKLSIDIDESVAKMIGLA